MTDNQKQEKPKQPNWIIKAGGDALLAGGATGLASLAGSLVFGWSLEIVPQIAMVGAAYSLYDSLKSSKEKDRPKKKPRGRKIPFNLGEDIKMEYSLQNGGVMVRESYFQAIWRKVSRKGSRPVIKPVESVSKPKELDEFVFRSHYDGLLVELRIKHVRLFLDNAWKNRSKHGKSLSKRQWVRRQSQRPAWYRELPCPVWYYAMRNLIIDAQNGLKVQMIVSTRNNWYQMACEPHEFLARLKWYESEKRKSI